MFWGLKSMVKLFLPCFAFLAILFTSGCASVAARAGFEPHHAKVYPGTVLEANLFIDPQHIQFGDGGRKSSSFSQKLAPRFFCLLDAPFSILIATLCLPFDIYNYVEEVNREKARPKRTIGETTFLIINPRGGVTTQLLWSKSNCAERASLDLLSNIGKNKTPLDKRYLDLNTEVSFDVTNQSWAVFYRATNGTDGIVCSDQILYTAPESGYEKEVVFHNPSRSPKYLYLRSRSPAIYSRIELTHEIFYPGKPDRIRIQYRAWINPYGERNLEFDDSAEGCWRVKDALTEEAKVAILAKRLPEKPDIQTLIKESNAKVAREKLEREKAMRTNKNAPAH